MKKPRYELNVYRQFIKEASPYVSLVVGRRIQPADADLMTDEQVTQLALLIDERVKDLNKTPMDS